LNSRFDNWNYLSPSCIIDTSKFQITRPHLCPWQYKIGANVYAIKYEIVCSLGVPEIIWVSGPWKGCASDPTIAKCSGILAALQFDEMILSDKIYRGDSLNFIHPISGKVLSYECKLYNYLIYSARQSIERVISRLKIFGIFSLIWRYSIDFHCIIFLTCCKLVNLFLLFERLG
jgi:hypothetical protein